MYTITTQTLENYGLHSSNGKFTNNKSFWKFKSGMTYIVKGVERIQDAVAFIVSIASENSIAYKEFVVEFNDGDNRDEAIAYVELDVMEYMNASSDQRFQMKSNIIWS